MEHVCPIDKNTDAINVPDSLYVVNILSYHTNILKKSNTNQLVHIAATKSSSNFALTQSH
ncbi:hypothetical protein O9G_000019 [Rozella allomycis CSF55]|uniref:Uncharacterized protein n=1 Tax=Rozella allomycis (strain CSF55) TaxID=988480 RepID=A0A075ASN3_ROZAC|nr:hypothetical protein O9G_000019 [Rozella allomycis CSF55]|eukprot:EPZ31543.1 hypothetical protein O9G_000019 [Rozella allomycis CSF55]